MAGGMQPTHVLRRHALRPELDEVGDGQARQLLRSQAAHVVRSHALLAQADELLRGEPTVALVAHGVDVLRSDPLPPQREELVPRERGIAFGRHCVHVVGCHSGAGQLDEALDGHAPRRRRPLVLASLDGRRWRRHLRLVRGRDGGRAEREAPHREGEGGEREGGGDAPRGARHMGGRRRDEARDAVEEAAPGGGQGQARRRRTQGLEVGQRARVGERVATGRDRLVVAAQLALGPDALGGPPHGRMVEEQSLHRGLQQADQGVVAPDVGQLVREHGLELPGAQAGQGRDGQQDRRPQPAHDGGHLDQRGLQHADGTAHAHARAEGGQAADDLSVAGRTGGEGQPSHEPPAARVADGKEGDTQAPRGDDAGEGGGDAFPDAGQGARGGQAGERARDRGRIGRAGGAQRGRRVADGTARGPGGEEGGRRQCRHPEEGGARQRIAQPRRSRAGRGQGGGEEERGQGALPHEVDEGPAEGVHRGFEASHRFPPSMSSSSRRMRSISAGEARRPERACSTSLAADPPNARSTRSRTSCRCVCASAARAA